MQVVPISFDQVWQSNSWEEIPNCPGRFTLMPRKVVVEDAFQFLSRCDEQKMRLFAEEHSQEQWIRKWDSGVVRDPLLVVRLGSECGLITYHNKHGYLHTLNNPSGFERKLKALHIYDEIFPSS